MKKTILARNIKKLRLFKSLNQSDFAALFDINRPSIGSYEEGRSEPKLATLQKIAQHFKISIDDLLSKELTVNKIAGFDLDEIIRKRDDDFSKRLSNLEKKLTEIEKSIHLLLKK